MKGRRIAMMGGVMIGSFLAFMAGAAWGNENIAVLRWLDKITARTSSIEISVGGNDSFGSLDIEVKACAASAPEDDPENSVFLDIRERQEGRPTSLLFRGWMFSSSPALSSLEHPVYDVWLVRCRNARSDASSSSR